MKRFEVEFKAKVVYEVSDEDHDLGMKLSGGDTDQLKKDIAGRGKDMFADAFLNDESVESSEISMRVEMLE